MDVVRALVSTSVLLALAGCGDASSEEPTGPTASEPATSATDGGTTGGIAALPVGDPPATDDDRFDATTEVPGPVDGLDRVWLTDIAALGLEPDGTLVVLGAGRPAEARDDRWRALTAERSPLGLPDDARVDGVVAESPRTVLVDVTDSAGTRAWVRCHVGLLKCALAELDPSGDAPQ